MKDIYDRIYVLMRQGAYSDVIDLLLDQEGKAISSNYKSDLNHAWYLVGDAFYKQALYQQAINAFQQAINEWEEDFDAMIAIANCYSEIGVPEKSELILRNALKVNPLEPRAKYNLANSLFDQEKFVEAIELYQSLRDGDQFILDSAKKYCQS